MLVEGKPLAMDSMNYHYIAGTNQLDYISDLVAKGNYKEDIDNQQIHNYVYDSIGNLIRDNAEKISSIDWTVYGKISRIVKTDTTEISYIYDASGQRIAKAVTKNNITDSTYYVRDASGNVMSVYEQNDTVRNDHVIQKEIDLYGSSRLGMLIAETDVDSIVPLTTTAYFVRGKKRYELTNHLGNVLVVISDVKKPIRSLTDTNLVVGYEPKVITATDYYPFGMQMPGRHGFATETGDWHGSYAYSTPAYLTVNHRNANTPTEYVASVEIELDNGFLTGDGNDNFVAYIADSATMATIDSAYQLVGGGYRYGFNGKEQDRDIQGADYDYGFRIYDPRGGRFLSVDPLTSKYSELTPYQFSSNRPIDGIDVDGLEYMPYQTSMYRLSTYISQGTAITTLMTVYENIPSQLQDPQTCDLKYSLCSPLNSDGTKYNALTDPPRIYNKYNKETNTGVWDYKKEKFYGSASSDYLPNKSTNGIDALKGFKDPNSSSAITADNINSIGNVVGANGLGGMILNFINYMYSGNLQGGLTEQSVLQTNFTNAVNSVDSKINGGILKTKNQTFESFNPQQRGSLINFVADGTLNYTNTFESMQASLTTAWYGVQILKNDGIKIHDETKEAIKELLKNYKSAGGGDEYNNISKYCEND